MGSGVSSAYTSYHGMPSSSLITCKGRGAGRGEVWHHTKHWPLLATY